MMLTSPLLFAAGTEAPLMTPQEEEHIDTQNRRSWRLMAPFLLLVFLVPVFFFRLLGTGSSHSTSTTQPGSALQINCPVDMRVYAVQKGETCWSIGQKAGMSVEELREVNRGVKDGEELECEDLTVGQAICVKGFEIGE